MEILIVEDNSGDRYLIHDAFKQVGSDFSLHFVEDGIAALDFLFRRSPYESAPAVDVVFLDLNLPRMSGREVLDKIKTDNALKHLLVIVLTGSYAKNELAECYRLHANFCLTKPSTYQDYFELIKGLHEFLFAKVILPSSLTPQR